MSLDHHNAGAYGGHKLQYNIASVLEEAVTEIRSYLLDTNSKGDPRGFSLFL